MYLPILLPCWVRFLVIAESGRSVINAGSLVQASEGFLIIDALRLIEDPLNWRILRDVSEKRT